MNLQFGVFWEPEQDALVRETIDNSRWSSLGGDGEYNSIINAPVQHATPEVVRLHVYPVGATPGIIAPQFTHEYIVPYADLPPRELVKIELNHEHVVEELNDLYDYLSKVVPRGQLYMGWRIIAYAIE